MEPELTSLDPSMAIPPRSSHALRGDYSHMRADYTVDQPLGCYSPADHDRWRRLYRRQIELMPRYAVKEYVDSLELLDTSKGIPDFARISAHLSKLTGFT